MQPRGGPFHHGWSSTSSATSPWYSPSERLMGFDSHTHHQHQHQNQRQSFQQHLLSQTQGNESTYAFQSGGNYVSSIVSQAPHQHRHQVRNFSNLSQQQNVANFQENYRNLNLGTEDQLYQLDYLDFALKQNSNLYENQPEQASMLGSRSIANESNTAVLSLPVSRQHFSGPNSSRFLSNSNIKSSQLDETSNLDRTTGKKFDIISTSVLNPSRKTFASDKIATKMASSSQDVAMMMKKPFQELVQKYHNGPLFDFPNFIQENETSRNSFMVNNNRLALGYDIKDLILGESIKKRDDNLRKIDDLLSVNLERKRISSDLVTRLKIEEKKLRLMDLQARVREKVEKEQKEIMTMPDKPYRRFVRLCELQREDLKNQVQASKKVIKEKHLKAIFKGHKKFQEAQKSIRDARTARKVGVKKFHDKMQREFLKRKDRERMEALKNNDVARYREMLLERQANIPGDATERYEALSLFLKQTEDYIYKLGDKISNVKNQEVVDEAAAYAQDQGLSKEVRVVATCARDEVNATDDSSSINKYYNLAHAVNEKVVTQPSMLRAGTLRDYQLVGLQWMLSLYNNKLNGILADEMGLGKTVQVMALIAYLMEFKGNYGPHLIIVPNAVLVNWKSELHNWLPSVSCVFYAGKKDQRKTLYDQEVKGEKFNILVTTYEFIMLDRSKLSKIDWNYIIIDEAQRMKDSESVLARDLNKYRCQRRLLLTGTPLQNDLRELWALLNLLLPQIFDNQKSFEDWFSQPFQKEGRAYDVVDEWLETEKKVIIIHRLHQILEPFMLRRRVEDVEGSLPPKVAVVLRCKMSAIQSAIYNWIKSTGTIRVDPEDEKMKAQANPSYQPKIYKPLTNKCMELRKTCNHPLLNYSGFKDLSKDFLVKSCGKLRVLDKILMKLHRTGHRVLLFSTMTKLLDILEEYLTWRSLVYRRIDGTTSLEERESDILEFNRSDSDCFIFLLSIRAAGRGLNLQSADTVVIYDPDPNPKNEEQAVARAHRIGQKREVKVVYLEAVANKIVRYQKEDGIVSEGVIGSEDDLPGNGRYTGTVESLIRNKIQQYKIDMADEVINAGRFDQRTTHEERRLTLEAMLHDEDRYQETVLDVPSLKEINRMIARSESEVMIFDEMDQESDDWADDLATTCREVPTWLRASTMEVNLTIAKMTKKPLKSDLIGEVDLPEKRRRGCGKEKKYDEPKSETDSCEGDDELALQPKPKKRRLRKNVEMPEEKCNEKSSNSMTSSCSKKMSENIKRKCKRVISKLRNKIEAQGPQIFPLLTDLWNNLESSGNINKIIDLRKIDQRIERFEYIGVKELISDVQFMLKSSMKHFGYSREVRSEARNVHEHFFDILKKVFKDTDYGEAKKALTFSRRATSPAQAKRSKLVNEVEPETTSIRKLPSRASRSNTEKPRHSMKRKESTVEISTSSRDQSQKEDQRSLTHPGDLAICRKKRNARRVDGPVGHGWANAEKWFEDGF